MVFDDRLIELIRVREFLYDKTHDSYRNNELKDQEWSNIANDLNTTMERCKKRWASLRDRYKRIRKQGSGSGIKRRWKHYDALSFVPCSDRSITSATNNFEENELLIDDTIIEKEETQICSPQPKPKYYLIDEDYRNLGQSSRKTVSTVPAEISIPSPEQEERRMDGMDDFFIYLAKRVRAANLDSLQEMRVEAAILNFTVEKLCEILNEM